MISKDWKQFTPFYFYTVAALGLGVAAALSKARSMGSILLLLVVGFLTWAPFEYVLHRVIFHYKAQTERARAILYTMHLEHHDYPKAVEQLFANLRMSVPFALCYCLLAWAILGSWQSMAYLFIGFIGGYFSYEWLHYQAHHRAPRMRVFQYLKKYHLLHHHQTPDLRFGVTSPFIDYLFGTFQPVSKRSLPTSTRTLGLG